MGMFDSYDSLDPNVIPDNISSKPSDTYKVLDDELPHKMYSIKGNFIGYNWSYGDEFTFKASPNKSIKVLADSLIYINNDECPNTRTVGYKGQQAYNIVDYKSWTCVGNIDGLYIWIEDDDVTYPVNGTIEISFAQDMSDKVLRLDIYNFRWEKIKTYETIGEPTITCIIDENTYKFMPSGIYHATLTMSDDNVSKVVDKFMISIS